MVDTGLIVKGIGGFFFLLKDKNLYILYTRGVFFARKKSLRLLVTK